MGLDTSHDCWHGSYSSFSMFRNILAQRSGWAKLEFGDKHYEIAERDKYHARNYHGWWDEEPKDILDVFFVHSDCEGYIFPEHARKLAEALAAIDLSAEIDTDYWVPDKRVAFVAGLLRAADAWEVVTYH